jgi:hypothetical protein
VEDGNVLSHAAILSAGYFRDDRYPIVLDNGRQAMVTRYVTPCSHEDVSGKNRPDRLNDRC